MRAECFGAEATGDAMRLNRRRTPAFTLTELLVVLSIMIVLVSILAPAMGAFAHTSRVVAAADSLASMFRQARFYAMSHRVQVIPMIMKDTKDNFSAVYAAQAGTYKGVDSTFVTDCSPSATTNKRYRYALTRQAQDLPQLQKGAFVFFIPVSGAADLNVNIPDMAPDPNSWFELMFMRVTPTDPARINDSSTYRYEILKRELHNTAKGAWFANRKEDVVIYMVISGTKIDPAEVTGLSAAAARDYTISGLSLPNKIVLDVVTNAAGQVCAPVTAQAAIFREKSFAGWAGARYPPSGWDPAFNPQLPDHFPIFLPIFMPDGRVLDGKYKSGIGSVDANRSAASGIQGQTLRVMDSVSREALYVTVRSGGQVEVSKKLPDREWPAGTININPVPLYNDVYVQTSTSSSSSSSSSSGGSSSGSSGETPPDVESAPPPPTPEPPGTSSGDGGNDFFQ
jgi:Tfp pilus assembly protein FimT